MHAHIINLFFFQTLFYFLFQKVLYEIYSFFSRYVEIVSVACNKETKNSIALSDTLSGLKNGIDYS